jgi:hypothetical protein
MKNLGRAFAFMFEDKEWIQKILIGAAFTLLSVILVGIPIILGYLLEVARRSAEGKELPLPEWDNLGDKFGKGLLYFIILVIYSIPLGILSAILAMIPCLGAILWIVPFLFLAMVAPYLAVTYARTANLNAAFEFEKIIRFISDNLSNLLIVLVMTIIFEIIAGFGLLALGIGVLVTSFWDYLGIYYLYGQVFWEAEQGGAAVIEGPPPTGETPPTATPPETEAPPDTDTSREPGETPEDKPNA